MNKEEYENTAPAMWPLEDHLQRLVDNGDPWTAIVGASEENKSRKPDKLEYYPASEILEDTPACTDEKYTRHDTVAAVKRAIANRQNVVILTMAH